MSSALSRLIRSGGNRSRLHGQRPQSRFEDRRELGPPVGLPRDFVADPHQRAAVDEHAKWMLDDPEVQALISRDETPIPATQDREKYFDSRHLMYWLSGLLDYRTVRKEVPSTAFARVLDLGGATGRFARHVLLNEERSQVTLAELNADHVRWCNRNFGDRLRAVKVAPQAHLPFPDASITLCVALSVFTHIDEYETAWLAEISRVLAPGGFAYITIQSEDTWDVLEQQPWLLTSLRDDPRFDEHYDSQKPMPTERLVYNFMPGTQHHCCHTFVHSEYVRHNWGKWMDVIAIRPKQHHSFQTAVLLAKRKS